jgi:outer membrane protein TolC
MKKLFFILINVLLFTSVLFSQVDDVHKELLRLALENNYEIQKAELDIANSEQQVKQVKAYTLPQLSGSIDVKNYIELPTVILPGEMLGAPNDIETHMGRPYNGDIGISASYLIPNQALLTDLKAVKESTELYKLLKVKTEEDVIYQVSYLYYCYLASLESLKIIEENIEILKENKRIAANLVNNDMALPTDTNRIVVKINDLEKQVNLIEASLLEQENGIRLLIGNKDYQFLEPNLNIELNQNNQEIGLVDSVKRTDILILEKQLEIENLQIKKSKTAYRPTTSLYASYAYNVQQNDFADVFKLDDWNNISLIGLKMTIPIFSGGRNKAKVQQIKLNYQIAEKNIEQATQNFNQERQQALNKFFTLQENCEIQFDNIEQTNDIYKVSLLKYEEGLLPLTELLISTSDLSNAKLSYTKSLLELFMAELDVLKSNCNLNTLTNK